jgi:hypothetical protein
MPFLDNIAISRDLLDFWDLRPFWAGTSGASSAFWLFLDRIGELSFFSASANFVLIASANLFLMDDQLFLDHLSHPSCKIAWVSTLTGCPGTGLNAV